MTIESAILLGNVAVIDVVFERINAKDRKTKIPVDPTTITLTVTRPDGTVDTYAKAQLTNPEVGRYRLHYTPAAASLGRAYAVKVVAAGPTYSDEFSVSRQYASTQRQTFTVAAA